jgi:pimeloyl-ACP methyl ester carboxylesterase
MCRSLRQMIPPVEKPPAAARYEQEIQFCMTPDGVQLAYARIGSGPPLVKTGNWMTHLEFDFESPIWRGLYRELSRDRTLIRYDARGNGLSDRDVEDVSQELFVSDLETVVDAAGLERFALLGISQGCAVSIAYAVRHPERVSHLVLVGGYPVGWAKRARTAAEKEQGQAMLTLMRLGWGQENPRFASSSPRNSSRAAPRSRPTGSTNCSGFQPRPKTRCAACWRSATRMSARCWGRCRCRRW